MTQFTAYIHRPFRRFFLHFITQVSRNAVYRYTYILTSGDVCNSSYLQSPQHILCVFWRGNLKLSGEKNGVLVPILFTNVINCLFHVQHRNNGCMVDRPSCVLNFVQWILSFSVFVMPMKFSCESKIFDGHHFPFFFYVMY